MSPTTTAFSSPSPSPAERWNHPNKNSSEDDVNKPVPGWPSLAKTVADTRGFAAFPSFTDLNVKSLLYYQAQLIRLRKELHKTEFEDYFHGADPERNFADDLDWMFDVDDSRQSGPEQKNSEQTESEEKGSGQDDSEQQDSDEEDSQHRSLEQLRILEKIRTILDKYNNALIQFSQVSAFPDADSSNVDCLRKFARKVCDPTAIIGTGSQTWGTLRAEKGTSGTRETFWPLFWGLFVGFFKTQEVKRDPVKNEFQEHLIVPRVGSKPDGLTTWVTYSFIPLFHHVWQGWGSPTWAGLWTRVTGPFSSCHLPKCWQDASPPTDIAASRGETEPKDEKNLAGVTAYSKSWIFRVTSILTTIVACLLPVIAIVVLSRVHSMGMILGLIALFNSIFAFGLVLISTGSSRVDIFTATAAFSAVMVVFVQNKIGQN
ncbi:uncharacterized protein LY89DRAFT_741686 [Mollisia scopiformis]|uniref:DUF6594 domain-containing protein n=1 Tax=Mollisia scopiformis TaxID=149040 RepID=A0A132B8X0_MOLSC|nr:uncharacterized protein LY89DRAFT_741686 [Mollisia scopiformis]KUJ08852.1 hypothetical protein LY89DRAFT_741686 [Mollisia scopiformis]